ncbi:MAG TPA: hypothetical protein VJ911_04225 [Cryomorphaceae bacterium]|nr:hypothetical protein [Cryomorphaceae bacterium]
MFRIIAIILLIYFGVKLLGRLFAPLINPQSKRPDSRGSDHNRPEGDVRVEYTKKSKSKKSDSSEGEYVDFEEVD